MCALLVAGCIMLLYTIKATYFKLSEMQSHYRETHSTQEALSIFNVSNADEETTYIQIAAKVKGSYDSKTFSKIYLSPQKIAENLAFVIKTPYF